MQYGWSTGVRNDKRAMTTTDSIATASRRSAGAQARRVIFIDLARALAVVFMLYGHTVDALLAPAYRTGVIFSAWQFQRGLTSCLFLLLSGFAFSIATARHWTSHLTISAALFKRMRRFGLFIAIGYAMRVPVAPLSRMREASEADWRMLFGVDVLQLVGVTFLVVQVLVLITRSRRVFSAVAIVIAAALLLTTPSTWAIDWTGHLHPALAAYLTPNTGSQFPLVPWAAFVLMGAALGQIYARWGAANVTRYANLALLAPALVVIAVGLYLSEYQSRVYGATTYAWVPGNMLLRTGVCLLIVGVIAHASRRVHQLPHVFGAVAQESLLIYVLHLFIVFGSVFAPGFLNIYGPTLSPLQLLPLVAGLIAAMAVAAYGWNWLKHTHGRLVWWGSLAAGALLVVRLVR